MSCCPAVEEWRPVGERPRYQVSSHGRVRNSRGKVLTPIPSDRGYLKVDLYDGHGRSSRVTRYVHRLVLCAFVGPPPAGHDVDHRDWNRHHNCRWNLRWMRYEENHVRWQSRTPDGRNVWDTPDDVPEDAVTPDPAETAEITRELAAVGWTP